MKKSEITRTLILDAAARMFRRKGYEATTLNDIGKLVGIRAAAVYYHFESKENLLEEVLDIGIDRIHEAVRQAVEAMPPDATHRERIGLAIRIHLATLLQRSDYTAANIINYGLSPENVRTRHHTHREAYGDCWRKLLQDARDAGEIGTHVDLSLLRLFLIGALNWSHEWYRPDLKPIDEMAQEICDMLFDGVK